MRRARSAGGRANSSYSLGVFVVHDGEKFIHRQHLGQRLSVEQFLGSLQGDGVGQGPVRVVGHHQVANVLNRLLVPRVHLLPAEVSAATWEKLALTVLCQEASGQLSVRKHVL